MTDNNDTFDLAEAETKSVLRRLIWDATSCPEAEPVCELMGLVPTSDDVTQMEHLASHARFDAVAPLVPRIIMYADLLAQMWTKAQTSHAVFGTDEQGILETHMRVIRSALLGAITSMVADGVLHIGEHQ